MPTEQKANRLINEKSPYLLQHAYNPVDWYPWGNEAFEKAKAENKPIFLSVGYSTCHWCHVMEEESFESQEIADVLNQYFVPVKVDREERPDVDQVYMEAVQAMTGSGGWPLSIFLTPEKIPFFGGTYFPPDDRYGRPGFNSILVSLASRWKDDQENILKVGKTLLEHLHKKTPAVRTEGANLDEETLKRAYQYFEQTFDPVHGGFGQAPKFPRTHVLSFLLRYWKRYNEPHALKMVEKTLQAMAYGGIYDHLGGGFHRYSTDEEWHVPHFEKMLYDQALITRSYLEAYQITQNPLYAKVAKETFDYLFRLMTSEEGSFYSAEDADSALHSDNPHEKAEGAFYVWEAEEIETLLGKDDAKIFNASFQVQSGGNAKHDPHQEFTNKNILARSQSTAEIAKSFSISEEDVEKIIADSKPKLIKHQQTRPRPHLDDKILTDWNALMISTLAFGARVLEEPSYLAAAEKATQFILTKMKDTEGRLLHRYRDGEVAIRAFLDDYAFLILALEDLYEASHEPHYLAESIRLAEEMKSLFGDPEHGGFFFSPSDGEELITQTKELYDGAIPSGNSVALLALLKLTHFIPESKFEDTVQNSFDFFSKPIAQTPMGYPQSLIALDFLIGPAKEVVVAGDPNADATKKMIFYLSSQFLPNQVLLFHSTESPQKENLQKLSPFIAKQVPLKGTTTAYICKNHVCDLPTTNFDQFKELLNR